MKVYLKSGRKLYLEDVKRIANRSVYEELHIQLENNEFIKIPIKKVNGYELSIFELNNCEVNE